MSRTFRPETRSTMTRRYSTLASLCLAATSLSACDAAPEGPSSSAEAPADETPAEIEDPLPPPGDDEEEDVDADADCEPVAPVRPRVMFVLDKSSSMTNSGQESGVPLADGELSRWAQLHALVSALADGMETEALTGAVLFPSTYAETAPEATCNVRTVPEAAVGPYRAEDLVGLLPPADARGFLGGSPAHAAYATALDHLDGLSGAAPTAIVLITDGGLNCADDVAPLDVIDEDLAGLVAFARGSLQIQTFVIGVGVAPGDQKVPNGAPDRVLREIALAGGAAHGERGYFTLAETQPLVQALDGFLDRAHADAVATTCR
jgi:hypothetical protein